MSEANELLRRALEVFDWMDVWNKTVEDIRTYLANQETTTKDEPVAWTNEEQLGYLKDPRYSIHPMAMWSKQLGDNVNIPLYLHPQKPKNPMTEEECANLITQDYRMDEYFDAAVKLIRNAEKHHGIIESSP